MSAPLSTPVVSPRTRLGLAILGAALALGLTGDLLLRAMPWGLNVTLCAIALVAAGAGLIRWGRLPVGADAPWIALTILLLGAAFARRDAQMLSSLDVVGLLLALSLAAASVQGVRIQLLDVADHIRTFVTTALGTVVGSLPLAFRDIAWQEIPQQGPWQRVRAVGLGALLALPLLLVFGALFMGADAVFNNLVTNALAIDPKLLFSHAFATAFWAAITGGYLRFALLARRPDGAPATIAAPGFGAVPVATALGLIGLLFLVFVVVQARYFFGGASVIEQTTGLTYAEYARRGFFELVAASGLVLPVLLGADWLVRGETAEHRRTIRQLSGVLLGLLAVVMASALERMRLYVAAFGLSEIRLYATAFMTYLMVMFAWFGWAMIRAQPQRTRFAVGGLFQGFAVLAGLHLLNPDAFIVRRNLTHPGSERPFDVRYATKGLSGDAVPALVAALPSLPDRARCDAARDLLARWNGSAPADWRTWNWGRRHARALVRDNEARLRAWQCAATDSTDHYRNPESP
jgi:uncharacterized protein DUF4153